MLEAILKGLEIFVSQVFKLDSSIKRKKEKKTKAFQLEKIKTQSDKIKIILSDCVFKPSSNQNARITLKVNYNAKEYTIKKTLGIEPDRLRIWFALQKETDLYIQKFKKEEYLKDFFLSYEKDIDIKEAELELKNTEDVLFYDEIYVYEYYLDLSFIEEN